MQVRPELEQKNESGSFLRADLVGEECLTEETFEKKKPARQIRTGQFISREFSAARERSSLHRVGCRRRENFRPHYCFPDCRLHFCLGYRH
jgi:hypothetical protein